MRRLKGNMDNTNIIKSYINKDEVISAEEIKMILDRYRIGKKPLAKLLGWGETTIIRYMDGDIPTSEYSNKLQMIMNYPEYYYNLLLERKDCLTNIAYRKSKQAVINYIMSSKISAVAYYIINLCDADISPKYLQYILYYAQIFSLAMYDSELFPEECLVNNEYVPYKRLYNQMKHTGIHTLEISGNYLTQKERELIKNVYESISWYGPRALKAVGVYDKSNMKISRDQYNNRIISKENLKNYYRELFREYNITSVRDISKYLDLHLQELRDRA